MDTSSKYLVKCLPKNSTERLISESVLKECTISPTYNKKKEIDGYWLTPIDESYAPAFFGDKHFEFLVRCDFVKKVD